MPQFVLPYRPIAFERGMPALHRGIRVIATVTGDERIGQQLLGAYRGDIERYAVTMRNLSDASVIPSMNHRVELGPLTMMYSRIQSDEVLRVHVEATDERVEVSRSEPFFEQVHWALVAVINWAYFREPINVLLNGSILDELPAPTATQGDTTYGAYLYRSHESAYLWPSGHDFSNHPLFLAGAEPAEVVPPNPERPYHFYRLGQDALFVRSRLIQDEVGALDVVNGVEARIIFGGDTAPWTRARTTAPENSLATQVVDDMASVELLSFDPTQWRPCIQGFTHFDPSGQGRVMIADSPLSWVAGRPDVAELPHESWANREDDLWFRRTFSLENAFDG